MIRPPALIDAGTAEQLLPLLTSAIVALVENSDPWLTEATGCDQAEARFLQIEALGEDIAVLARAGRAVLRNQAAT